MLWTPIPCYLTAFECQGVGTVLGSAGRIKMDITGLKELRILKNKIDLNYGQPRRISDPLFSKTHLEYEKLSVHHIN